MSKAKFAAARELINEKKYDQARSILKTIDHPTATEWLRKLDEIAPAKSASNNPLRKNLSSESKKTVSTQVNNKNNPGKNRLKLGIIGIVGILIVVVTILILIPKMINRGGNAPSSETSQLESTKAVTVDATQIESLVIYCMKQADLSRNECTTFAQNVSSDSETASSAAQCTATYADNLDSLTICMKDIEKILQHRTSNRAGQLVALYLYCGGSNFTFTELTQLGDDVSPGPVSDKACREWAKKLDLLHPSLRSSSECAGTTSNYFELIGGMEFDRENTVDQFVTVVNCMSKNLGTDFPPLPACDNDHPERMSCQKPKT